MNVCARAYLSVRLSVLNVCFFISLTHTPTHPPTLFFSPLSLTHTRTHTHATAQQYLDGAEFELEIKQIVGDIYLCEDVGVFACVT